MQHDAAGAPPAFTLGSPGQAERGHGKRSPKSKARSGHAASGSGAAPAGEQPAVRNPFVAAGGWGAAPAIRAPSFTGAFEELDSNTQPLHRGRAEGAAVRGKAAWARKAASPRRFAVNAARAQAGAGGSFTFGPSQVPASQPQAAATQPPSGSSTPNFFDAARRAQPPQPQPPAASQAASAGAPSSGGSDASAASEVPRSSWSATMAGISHHQYDSPGAAAFGQAAAAAGAQPAQAAGIGAGGGASGAANPWAAFMTGLGGKYESPGAGAAPFGAPVGAAAAAAGAPKPTPSRFGRGAPGGGGSARKPPGSRRAHPRQPAGGAASPAFNFFARPAQQQPQHVQPQLAVTPTSVAMQDAPASADSAATATAFRAPASAGSAYGSAASSSEGVNPCKRLFDTPSTATKTAGGGSPGSTGSGSPWSGFGGFGGAGQPAAATGSFSFSMGAAGEGEGALTSGLVAGMLLVVQDAACRLHLKYTRLALGLGPHPACSPLPRSRRHSPCRPPRQPPPLARLGRPHTGHERLALRASRRRGAADAPPVWGWSPADAQYQVLSYGVEPRRL